MPAKVVILAQFDHGYYIRETLKRLTDVVDWLKARWIRFEHGYDNGYYIHGTLKWLAGFFAWLKAWWIRLSVQQVTDQKYMSPLPWRRGNAHKSHDFGSVWPWILYPWDFEEVDGFFWLGLWLCGSVYYIRETLKRLTDVVAWLKAWWICVSVKQVTDQKSMPLLPRWGGKVVFWLGSGLRGLKVLNTWHRCSEFHTLLASKSPALR
ncbi:hypothetical protein C8R44DRAFT_731282 [Mycena epipterygia]|nr:hypothetical protein C8R44DRAFT_731282 [Mycena epipterygia]